MHNGISLINSPQIAHLPQSLLDGLVAVEAVFVGTHNTLKCYYKNGQVWYLKTARTKLSSDSLQYEAEITQHLNAQSFQHLDVPQIAWRDNKGMSLATKEVTGQLMTTELLLSILPVFISTLIEVHTATREQVNLATWRIEQLKQTIDSILATKNDEWLLRQRFHTIESQMKSNKSAAGCPMGLVHGDLNQGNILVNTDTKSVALLDWECAQYTDVRWDLASVIVEFELNDVQTQTLLLNYVQKFNLMANFDKEGILKIEPNAFVQGAQHWIDFYRLTCLCWALKHNHPLRLYL